MTAAVAALAAALYGGADFLGGLGSRRVPVALVTLVSQAIGLVVMLAVTVVWRPTALTPSAIAWGAVAGLAGGTGILAFYAALATGRMSVVAPVTAALSASLPALFDLARGTRPHVTALAGIALALAAVVIVSVSTGDDPDLPTESARRALALSILAGIGFAGFLVAISMTSPASGFVPLVVARSVTMALALALALVQRVRFALPSDTRSIVVGAGVLDASANVVQLVAVRLGPLAVASVIGSLYSVATVLLARGFLGERLLGRQRVAVGLALVAVVLAAWP